MKEKSFKTLTPGGVVIELFFFVADAPANCLLQQLFAPGNCLLRATVCSGQLFAPATGQLFVPAKSLKPSLMFTVSVMFVGKARAYPNNVTFRC
jgi:hypothetical protein